MARHAVCPGCGKRIGVYEPIWHVAPNVGADPTSWLALEGRRGVVGSSGSLESLWHAECAEAEGIPGG
jgi:hypothetical protein